MLLLDVYSNLKQNVVCVLAYEAHCIVDCWATSLYVIANINLKWLKIRYFFAKLVLEIMSGDLLMYPGFSLFDFICNENQE